MKAKQPKRKQSALPTDSTPALRVDSLTGEAVVDLQPETVSIYRRWYTYLSREKPLPKRLGLVSAIRGEGVTTISSGLAAVIAADLEAKVALVECNWWWPGLAAASHLAEAPGLAEWVAGTADMDAVVQRCSLPNLALIPAGKMAEQDRSRAARGATLAGILAQLDQVYDLLILDIPAILAVKDSPVLAGLASDLCLVLRQGITPMPVVRKGLDEIEHLPLRGVVLNGMKAHLSKGFPFLNLGDPL